MKLIPRTLLVALAATVCLSVPALASQTPPVSYYLAKVLSVAQVNATNPEGLLTVKLLQGPRQGMVLSVPATGLYSASDIALPTYKSNDTVVVTSTLLPNGQAQYSVIDHWRLPVAIVVLAVVVLFAVLIAGWRGIGSLLGLVVSLAVIGGYILPSILHGANAELVSLIGCCGIATMSIYLAHGFSRRTTISLASVYLTLALSIGASIIVVKAANLNGIATEDASYLHQQLPALDIQGVLLAGITIGVLGVLDDISIGQAAAVDELRKANKKLSWQELYWRGIRVGREHIASLINTLVLAYAGGSFVFIAYVVAVLNLPLWLTLNSELVMEEIVRSLVGSLALILAVPIATLASAYLLTHRFPSRLSWGRLKKSS